MVLSEKCPSSWRAGHEKLTRIAYPPLQPCENSHRFAVYGGFCKRGNDVSSLHIFLQHCAFYFKLSPYTDAVARESRREYDKAEEKKEKCGDNYESVKTIFWGMLINLQIWFAKGLSILCTVKCYFLCEEFGENGAIWRALTEANEDKGEYLCICCGADAKYVQVQVVKRR